MQTTNPRIYAAGDVCSRYQFTHSADFMARIVIQNALFKGRAKASNLVIPWCTYTTPEVAHVGLYENEAEERGLAIQTFIQEFKDVDRAILEGDDEGFVKIHVKKGNGPHRGRHSGRHERWRHDLRDHLGHDAGGWAGKNRGYDPSVPNSGGSHPQSRRRLQSNPIDAVGEGALQEVAELDPVGRGLRSPALA